MEIQLRSDRNQNGIMIDSCKICQGALLGLFLFYVAFRLHSLILRLDALFFIHQSTPQHKPVMVGRCFGKAHPNQYQSTPQPLPKHILRVCFWCLLGCALVFVGTCFPECALVLPECALALPGVCFAKGWAPKKIPKIMQILFPKKRQKALVFIGTLLL